MGRIKYTKTEKLMLKLSYIAYASLFGSDTAIQESIKNAIAKITPDQRLVWGPAIGHKKPESEKRPNFALIYIAQTTRRLNEYTVVVRGTNPFSFFSWLEQDLNVRHKVLWTKISPLSPAKDARISAATYRAMKIHENLRYPDELPEGKNFFEYLVEKLMQRDDLTINFTGHSLGGLMAHTLALRFYEILGTPEFIKYRERTGIHVYAFAGPTAGDKSFAAYSDCILKPPPSPKHCTRYINEADVAVNAWHKDDMEKILNFYEKTIPISAFVSMILHFLNGMVKTSEYTQPAHKKVIAEYKEILKIADLEDMDLATELGLEEQIAFYIKKYPGISVGDVPDEIKKTLVWLLVAVYEHVFPYIFRILQDRHEINLILDEIIFPLIDQTYPGTIVKEALKKSLWMQLEN